MTLDEYLKENTQLRLVELIRENGGSITQGAISHWTKPGKKIPAERVLELERASGGAMSRYDLRPDLYPRGY